MLSSLIWGGVKEEQQDHQKSGQPEVHEISDDDADDKANDEEAADEDEEQRYTAAQKGKGRASRVGRTSGSKMHRKLTDRTAGLAKADQEFY